MQNAEQITTIKNTPVYLIHHQNQLNEVISEVQNSKVIFVDTEFYREKTYWPIFCLLQINVNNTIYCIDVLSENIEKDSIKRLCLSDCLWVLHAAKQDLEILYTIVDKHPIRFFDTQVAAELCGIGEQMSYANLVEHFENEKLEKSQTRTKWFTRPLSKAQLVYAAEDVAYLANIYNKLSEKVECLKREQWLDEELNTLEKEVLNQFNFENAYKRLKKSVNYHANTQLLIKNIANWREAYANKNNIIRNKVISDDDIYSISYHVMQKSLSLQSLLNKPERYLQQVSLVNNIYSELNFIITKTLDEINGKSIDLLWYDNIVLSKLQKAEISGLLQKYQKWAQINHLVSSRFARKKDIVQSYLFNKGRLTKGWRKKVLNDNF